MLLFRYDPNFLIKLEIDCNYKSYYFSFINWDTKKYFTVRRQKTDMIFRNPKITLQRKIKFHSDIESRKVERTQLNNFINSC